jgi:hypothetical protein
MQIVNLNGKLFTNWAADVLDGDVFTYRISATEKGGVHPVVLRDIGTRQEIARITSSKGKRFNIDEIQRFIEQQ